MRVSKPPATVPAATPGMVVSVKAVNARGLEGMPMEMTAQFGPAMPDQDVGAAFTDQLDAVDPDLTIEGLAILAERASA